MIRVLHSVSNMDRAGIETMLMNYYRHIDRTQVQFDFLCNKSKPGDYDAEIQSLGGHIYHSPGLNPLKRREYMRFMKQLLSQNPEIQILHAHNEAMAEYALEGACRAGLPVRIFHAHNIRIDFDYKWPLKILCKQFLRFYSTQTWACGRDAGAYYFGRRAVNQGNVFVLHNAIDPDRFAFSQAARDIIRKKYQLEGKFVIGHVGRLNHQKNHAFLLKAFHALQKKIPNAHLVLIGTGELEGALREQISRYALSEAVTMTGTVSNTHAWYSAMDVFAMPSLFEGLPVVCIEAQANGLHCVLSTNVTAEVNISGQCDFLPLEVSAWEKKLSALNGIGRFQDAKAHLCSHGYSIQEEAEKLTRIYLEMAQSG